MTTLATVALADPHYGYGYLYGGPGIAVHPGVATSFVARSPQGIGKRSADSEPEPEAEADPHYLYYGQYNWPSVTGYGVTSTCYGCRGKRSADAEPHYGYGLGYGYGHRYGLGLGYGYGRDF